MRDQSKITYSPVRYFPGGNTGKGFVSRFDGIVPPWAKPHYTYVIKGGPGVGKSTLMKKISAKAQEMGYMTEEFPCSGDPDSLDAVRIPAKGIVVLDGTSPHSIDPVTPGAAQEVLNLGCFREQDRLRFLQPEIESLFAENKYRYSVVYSYLAAAAELKASAIGAVRRLTQLDVVRDCVEDLMGKPDDERKYLPRKLFSSAITHKGVIDLTRNIPGDGITIAVGSILGYVFLEETERLLCGRRAQVFSDRLIPHIPERIQIPGSKLTFAVSADDESDIDHGDLMAGILPSFVEFNMAESDRLISKAVEQLKVCKAIHDEIELKYRPFIDFDRINVLGDEVMAKIEL